MEVVVIVVGGVVMMVITREMLVMVVAKEAEVTMIMAVYDETEVVAVMVFDGAVDGSGVGCDGCGNEVIMMMVVMVVARSSRRIVTQATKELRKCPLKARGDQVRQSKEKINEENTGGKNRTYERKK